MGVGSYAAGSRMCSLSPGVSPSLPMLGDADAPVVLVGCTAEVGQRGKETPALATRRCRGPLFPLLQETATPCSAPPALIHLLILLCPIRVSGRGATGSAGSAPRALPSAHRLAASPRVSPHLAGARLRFLADGRGPAGPRVGS